MSNNNNTNTLPPPDKPYGLWARFVTDLYEHGKRHAQRSIVRSELELILPSLVESFERPDEPPQVRPSGNLSCPRQAYLLEKYGTAQDKDMGLGATFASGHYFHAMAFAYCKSAVPPGFELVTEEEPEQMPTWWLQRDTFRQTGHRDLVLRIVDEDLAAKYLQASAGSSCLVDFKTMGAWSFRKHCQGDPWEGPDGFGYMAQLAVYSDGGSLFDEVVLAGMNRDQLWKPLKCRVIPQSVLSKEMYRVRKGFEALESGTDPGCEFFMRWAKQAEFICGVPGTRFGACDQSENCHKEGWPV